MGNALFELLCSEINLCKYFHRIGESNGDSWMVVTTMVEDPVYLTGQFQRSSHYKLERDGQFLLWSVGEDFKDDGGDTTPTHSKPGSVPVTWSSCRDWVWPQPASEAEVAAYHAELEAKRTATPPKP